jgi:hypothetical protein
MDKKLQKIDSGTTETTACCYGFTLDFIVVKVEIRILFRLVIHLTFLDIWYNFPCQATGGTSWLRLYFRSDQGVLLSFVSPAAAKHPRCSLSIHHKFLDYDVWIHVIFFTFLVRISIVITVGSNAVNGAIVTVFLGWW